MSKKQTRNLIVMVVVTIVLAFGLMSYLHSTGSAPTGGNASAIDGTYTSTENGFLSQVTVTVTVTDGAVADVQIDASGETPELGGQAAETLAASLLAAGSAEGVDAVTGATLTSNAVLAAFNDCLAQASAAN